MLALLRGEIAQELAQLGVLRPLRGLLVVTRGLELHQRDPAADVVDARVTQRLDRIAAHEAADVLAADERDLLAELLAEQLDQAAPVRVFLCGHAVERRRRLREVRTEQTRELAEDARVLFLERDREAPAPRAPPVA